VRNARPGLRRDRLVSAGRREDSVVVEAHDRHDIAQNLERPDGPSEGGLEPSGR
jgi:hypothetical protein